MACDKCGEITTKDLENEQYINSLKEQLEDKSRLVNSLAELLRQREQELLLANELLKGNSRELGD